jgi:dTDP-4-amino-4,6-dideoxygalactose transaminase
LKENSILVVSLHATKLLGAGEGGVCITNSSEVAKELKAWSNFGFQGTRESKYVGTNAKLSEYNAAVGLASLDMWEETRAVLQQHLSKALKVSESCRLIPISSMLKNFVSPYWIVSFESSGARNLAQERLNKNGIETRTWWGDGCHTMPAYAPISRRELPNTEWAASTSLGLPFHAYLSDADFEHIHGVLSS